MNLRQLRAFVLIAEHGSIRAAARALCVTQPAATRSLRELEQSLGAELVRRSAKGVELTPYGQALHKRAVLILQEARRAQEDIDQMRDGEGGTLNLAISSSVLPILPAALAAFRARMPRVAVAFHEVAPPYSHEQLETGRYDLVVQTEYDGDIYDGFARTTLFTLPLAVGARADHPLRHATDLAELRDLLWLMPGNTQTPTNLLRLAYTERGLPPPADVIPCQSIAIALAILGQSDAVGFFVRNGLHRVLAPTSLCILPLAHPLPAARVSILTRADSPPTPAAQFFIDCLNRARSAAGTGGLS